MWRWLLSLFHRSRPDRMTGREWQIKRAAFQVEHRAKHLRGRGR
jgi:hypothetical protein